MIGRQRQILMIGVGALDAAAAAAAWILAYETRFLSEAHGWIPAFIAARLETGHLPPIDEYLKALPVCILLCLLANRVAGLYDPLRLPRFGRELRLVFAATVGALILMLGATFFYRDFSYSRSVVALWFVFCIVLTALERGLLRRILAARRRQGVFRRRALIVGAGRLGQTVAERLARNPWAGIKPVGFLDDRPGRQEQVFSGAPVLGTLARLREVINEQQVDQVFIALPGSSADQAAGLLRELSDELVDVRFVPHFPRSGALRPRIDDFHGLPLVSFQESPLYGWGLLVKRLFDFTFSLLALVALALPLLLIAIVTRLTSRGPVFYRQERMGLDGRTFDLLKFRSMRIDAETGTGPVWASADDPRRTRWGSFLRRWSLDELPQLFNVLKGDMSLVGPRPERPVFIEDFRRRIPRYMLRHRTKAGITGWAQVNGWRGNTSLRKRIQYDLYYIEHWSIWFDLKIILLTVGHVLRRHNAY